MHTTQPSRTLRTTHPTPFTPHAGHQASHRAWWPALVRRGVVSALCVAVGLLIFVRVAYVLGDDMLGFVAAALVLVTVAPHLMPRSHRMPSERRAS